jgi:hypothetical protein
MQDWSLHSDSTGGYFQCNRFLDPSLSNNNNANNAINDEDMLDEDSLWAEERGNAHAETMRIRDRNRKMARFIHYFTRFSAHGESVKMETKMSFDTMKRLLGGLKLTRQGKLIWLQQQYCAIPSPNTTLLSSTGVSSVSDPWVVAEEIGKVNGATGKGEEMSIEDLLATMELDEEVRQEILREHNEHQRNVKHAAEKAEKEQKAALLNSQTPVKESEETKALVKTLQDLQRRVFKEQYQQLTAFDVYNHQTSLSSSSAVISNAQQQQYVMMEECIRFVLDGFDELLRCRYVSILILHLISD